MGYIDPKLVDGAAAVVESFTCAICFNLFEKPRTACSKGHTFCLDCLSSPFRDGNLTGDPAICTIYVKKITGSLVRLKARPGDTILSLKQKIRDTEGIPLAQQRFCLLYTSPSPRDRQKSRMPSSA